MIARMMMQQDRERADALDGGYFSGTNAQRQMHLRNNRGYRSGGSSDNGRGNY
jgi:hypothetical protein